MVIMAVLWAESLWIADCWLLLIVQGCTALALYIGSNALLSSVIQKEVLAFLRGRRPQLH